MPNLYLVCIENSGESPKCCIPSVSMVTPVHCIALSGKGEEIYHIL